MQNGTPEVLYVVMRSHYGPIHSKSFLRSELESLFLRIQISIEDVLRSSQQRTGYFFDLEMVNVDLQGQDSDRSHHALIFCKILLELGSSMKR